MAVKALTFFKPLFFGVLVFRSAAVFLMLTAGLATLGQGLIQDPPQGRKDGIQVLGPDRAHLQLRAPAKTTFTSEVTSTIGRLSPII